jgi:pimeloyl-ACP methyl ester carboxylesterase
MPWIGGTLAVVGSGGALATGLAGLASFARRNYMLQRTPDEILTAETLDRWPLRVLHYRPAPNAAAYSEPIILCHGLAANSFNLDFDARYSVARYLAARGFHAFVPDLRGREGSWPDKARWRARHGYSFDDHAGLDAPAILDLVLKTTGAPRAFWIGHSMGGMVGYVLAGREVDRIAGLITLGSPTRMRMDHWLGRLASLALKIPLDPIPQRFFAQAIAPLITPSFPPFPDLTAVRGNFEPHVLRQALTSVIVDMPRRLLQQFTDWAWKEEPISIHGGVHYLDSVARVRAPLLCISAMGDRLAPPEDVRPGYDLSRSGDKTWICLGTGDADTDPVNGKTYGHVDMVLGRDAPDVIFPLLSRWLEARAHRSEQRRLVAG